MNSDLLKFCRYYKGEEENPYENINQNEAMFWFYEKSWISFITGSYGNVSAERNAKNLISEYLTDYLNSGLANFSFNDGIPLTLKTLLFNRYQHWNMSGVDGFMKFYKKEYLKER